MITRRYKKGDVYKIDVRGLYNPILEIEEAYTALDKIGCTFPCEVLEDNGEAICIILFKNIDTKDNYNGMVVLSNSFKPIHTKEIKKSIDKLCERLKVKEVVTYSLDIDTNNKWHRLLGFTDTGIETECFGYKHKLWKLVKEN